MIVAHQADIHSSIAKMSFDGVPGAPGTQMVPDEERHQRIGAWFETALPGQLQPLEDLAGVGFMVDTTLCWADICVFNRLTQLLDIDETLLADTFPKLRAVYERVAGLSSVRQWINEHGPDYPRGNTMPAI
jgi:glutathione S-transferase